MKLLLCFIVFYQEINVQAFYDERLLREYNGTAVLDQNDVNFFFYKNKDPDNKITLNKDSVISLSKNEEIIVIIHGYYDRTDEGWVALYRDGFLQKDPKYNVLIVDYSKLAFLDLPLSIYYSEQIGNLVGNFLWQLSKSNDIPIKKFLVVSASLGSHVAGIAGKTLQELGSRLRLLVALDPAAPLFKYRPPNKRLWKTDADTLIVIHTDGDRYGLAEPLGTIDYYVNGGDSQPGCPDTNHILLSTPETMCDHIHSWIYFLEAIQDTEGFVARKCESWKVYLDDENKCENVFLNMGNLHPTVTGKFYLKTNRESPFSLNNERNQSHIKGEL